jgi:hypothetical protein
MRVLETVLFEYVLGYILQGFAYCLGIYAFSIKKVDKKYLVASILLIVISYIMRLLPISFGVHTILILACLFLLSIFFLKMPALSIIRSILAITVLLLMTELVSVFCITSIVGQAEFNKMMSDTLGKAIIALPSSVIFAVIVVCAYFMLRKIKEKKSVKDGAGGS